MVSANLFVGHRFKSLWKKIRAKHKPQRSRYSHFQNGGRRHFEFTSVTVPCSIRFLSFKRFFVQWLFAFRVKFHKCIPNGGWVVDVCKKNSKWRLSAIWLPWTTHDGSCWSEACVQISYWSKLKIRRYSIKHFTSLTYNVFSRPKYLRLRILRLPLYTLLFKSSSARPPKGTSLSENTCYKPSRVVSGPAVWPGRGAKNTKKTKGRTKGGNKLFVRPAHPLFRS